MNFTCKMHYFINDRATRWEARERSNEYGDARQRGRGGGEVARVVLR